MTDDPQLESNFPYLVDDPDSPFYGLPRGVDNTVHDPQEEVLAEVRDQLGVASISDVVIDFSDANIEELRGNRFTSIVDALVYLGQAGILQFSSVTVDDDDEIGGTIGTSP